jgi:multidrug efflux pump subunit AcrA (membrane-fusion protein)
VLAAAGLGWAFMGGGLTTLVSGTPTAEPQLQTATARVGGLRVSISGAGTLTAFRTVDLAFPTAGTLAEVPIALGDTVSSGQILARLADLEALEAALADAELTLLNAQKECSDLRLNAPVTLAQAYQDYISAQGAYADALYASRKTDYARCSKEVNTRNAESLRVATESLENTLTGSAEWIEARSLFDTALANYDYCITYTESEKVSSNASLDLAKSALDLAELTYNSLKTGSGLDLQELALCDASERSAGFAREQAQLNLEGASLVAPMDGVVTYLASGAGMRAGTDTFITLSDVSQAMVEVQVDEEDLGSFQPGKPVEVVFDALPDEVFHGTLLQVEPELAVSEMVSTLKGLAQLDDAAAERLRRLPLGLNASVEVIAEEVQDVVLVPVEALRDLGDGQYAVFVLDAAGSPRLRVVEVGIRDISFAEIKSGLEAGEIVSTGLVAAGS